MSKTFNFSVEDLMNLSEESKMMLVCMQKEIEMNKHQEILEKHKAKYKMTKQKDGRYSTYVPNEAKKNNRQQLKKATEEELEKAVIEYYINYEKQQKQNSDKITLKDLYPRWIEHKSLQTTVGTVERNKTDWKKYYENTDIVNVPIKDFTKAYLEDWLFSLVRELSLTTHQYANMSSIINQMLEYAADLKIIEFNPFKYVKRPTKWIIKERKKSDAQEVFTKDELAKLKELAWEDYRNKVKMYEMAPLALLFQCQTGVRVGELCALKHEDINVKTKEIHVCHMLEKITNVVVDYTKTKNGDRYIPLTPEAWMIIEKAMKRQCELHGSLEKTPYIFSLTDTPITSRSIESLCTKYCEKIGCPHKSTHKIRKTVISSMIDEGININTIREFAGHADERTTLNNYCFDRSTNEDKRKAIENALKIG